MYKVLGFLVGAVCATLVALLARHLMIRKNGKPEYDERQRLVRGKAFEYGFYALLLYNAIYAMACAAAERELMEPMLSGVFGVYVGLLVLGLYTIRKGAFFPVGAPQGAKVGLLFAMGVLCAVMSARYAQSGALVADGMLTLECLQPIAALTFFALGVAILLRRRRDRREEAE
ncbi:MAG: hypothetical protein IJV43_07325 [Oscillospiraceae bacterium]|nr:hypothetical protein [Oscillospiraceae bacterium]